MIRMWSLLFFIAFLLDYVASGMLGPSDMVFKKFDHCDPPVETMKLWVTQRRHNRTTSLMDIIIETPYDVDDSFDIEVIGSLWIDGSWKPGAYYIKGKTCDVLARLLGDVFKYVLRQATGNESCPLPAGRYETKDYYFDNSQYNVPQVYGNYQTQLLISRDDVLEMCILVYLDMVPKNALGF